MDYPIVLVPQGAEYQAVCKGLRRANSQPIVQSIPVGADPVRRQLIQLERSSVFSPQSPVLVLGLCGSLSPKLSVGDVVLYRPLSPPHLPLSPPPHLVTGLTSDRVLCSATEKRQLGETSGADVVDMEGRAILEVLSPLQIPVTMLRVVSDDCFHDLPDLSQSVSPAGNLLAGRMAIAMARNPIAALRLIRGSLQGLKVLQALVSELYQTGG